LKRRSYAKWWTINPAKTVLHILMSREVLKKGKMPIRYFVVRPILVISYLARARKKLVDG